MNAKERGGKGGAGPQGTQLFSRDQIAELRQRQEEVEDGGHHASLLLISELDSGPATGTRFPLDSDRLTIGRSRVCDICIEEPSMSSEHARLVRSENAWRIINLLSTNGVFVNDEKVFSHRLVDGDEIRMGRTRFRFHDPLQAQALADSGAGARILWIAAGTVLIAALAALGWYLAV